MPLAEVAAPPDFLKRAAAFLEKGNQIKVKKLFGSVPAIAVVGNVARFEQALSVIVQQGFLRRAAEPGKLPCFEKVFFLHFFS